MKLLNLILVFFVLSFIGSIAFAENNIYGLGLVKVENVKYLGDKIFSFELRKTEPNSNHPLFKDNETISFTFNADELDGLIVVINKGLREDIKLTGKRFVNLLLEKLKNNESINLTCGIRSESTSEKQERKIYKLTYFQVNE